MCLLLETIRINDGLIEAIDYHQERVNHSIMSIFKIKPAFDLYKCILSENVPQKGLYKCRVIYDYEIRTIKFNEYKPRSINKIRIINDDLINYCHKFADRKYFETLINKNSDVDEIIICKNNMLTDTTFSNIALFDGNKWYTPSDFLLKGTRRTSLLNSGKIIEMPVSKEDIINYSKISLINSMLDLGDCVIDTKFAEL